MHLDYFGSPKRIAGAVAVQNYCSSGSTLLSSLLDDHPNILSLPGLSSRRVFFDSARFLKDGKFDARGFILSFKVLNERNNEKFLFELGLDELGPERSQKIGVDPDVLHDNYIDLIRRNSKAVGLKLLICAMYLAYARTLGRELADDLYIHWDVHSTPRPERERFAKMFPNAHVIHTFRQPSRAFVSGLRQFAPQILTVAARRPAFSFQQSVFERVVAQLYLDRAWPDNDDGQAGDLCAMTPIAESNAATLRSTSVALEDLHKDGEATMRAVAAWIGVPWHPCLLESTFDGMTWWNRPTSKRMSGFQGNQSEKPRSDDVAWAFDKVRIDAITALSGGPFAAMRPWWLRSRFALLISSLVPFKYEILQPLPIVEILSISEVLTGKLNDAEREYAAAVFLRSTVGRRLINHLLQHVQVKFHQKKIEKNHTIKPKVLLQGSSLSFSFSGVASETILDDREQSYVLVAGTPGSVLLRRSLGIRVSVWTSILLAQAFLYLRARGLMFRSVKEAAQRSGRTIEKLRIA